MDGEAQGPVIIVSLGTAGLRVAELLTRAGVTIHGIDNRSDAAAVGHTVVVVPPSQLPGVSGVPLWLRPAASATHGPVGAGELFAPGEVPLGILHGDGHCTPAPLPLTLAVGQGDQLLVAAPPDTRR